MYPANFELLFLRTDANEGRAGGRLRCGLAYGCRLVLRGARRPSNPGGRLLAEASSSARGNGLHGVGSAEVFGPALSSDATPRALARARGAGCRRRSRRDGRRGCPPEPVRYDGSRSTQGAFERGSGRRVGRRRRHDLERRRRAAACSSSLIAGRAGVVSRSDAPPPPAARRRRGTRGAPGAGPSGARPRARPGGSRRCRRRRRRSSRGTKPRWPG